jgi:predicted O-methyltransferase YrrM
MSTYPPPDRAKPTAMDISDTRKCNLWNLEQLARFLDVPAATLDGYYHEILDDTIFLDGLNDRLRVVRRDFGFTKGIFRQDQLNSVDWFAFERILLYVLLRHLRPKRCLETGVYYGGNTAFMLAALHRNRSGRLVSIDLPDSTIRDAKADTSPARHPLVGDTEFYEPKMKPGFIVPEYLKSQWQFIEGSSLNEIPKISEAFDFYLHDSDHSMNFLTAEIEAALPRLSPSAIVVVDDIDWSNAFFAFCVKQQLSPILFTDNGKDNLRVRTGMVKLNHPRNEVAAITGRNGRM